MTEVNQIQKNLVVETFHLANLMMAKVNFNVVRECQGKVRKCPFQSLYVMTCFVPCVFCGVDNVVPLNFSPGLVENSKCSGSEEQVLTRITTIEEHWTILLQSCKVKTQKLQEASQQQTFYSSNKDIDFWLGEVRHLNDWKIFSHAPYNLVFF